MKNRLKIALAGLGAGILAAGTAFQLSRHGYEEPPYTLVEADGRLEVRRYAPRVVAETVVYGLDESAATSEGFRRLAGYIFGGNEARTLGEGEADGNVESIRIAMTAPVETESVRIAMTTPVEAVAQGEAWVIRFTMPRDQSLDSLPRPEDDRVTLRMLPPQTVAVLSFSGRAGIEDLKERAGSLEASVVARGFEVTGEATLAQYDPPWVVGMLRRNEIHVPVNGTSTIGG